VAALPHAPLAPSVANLSNPSVPAKLFNEIATILGSIHKEARGLTSVVLVQPRGEAATIKTNAVHAKPVAPTTLPAAATMHAVTAATVPIRTPAAPEPAAPKPTKVATLAMREPTKAIAVAKMSRPPAQVKPTNEVVTIFGTSYKNAQVEKVDPDGIIISYGTAGGGMGMSKVYFSDLLYEFRQRYEKY